MYTFRDKQMSSVLNEHNNVNDDDVSNSTVAKNFDDDDDDDFDDNITITIDSSATGLIMPATTTRKNHELSKINSVMNASKMYTCNLHMDLEMQTELNNLIVNSIAPKTSKCIAVNFNRRIILIPTTQVLSSRLQSMFWAPARQYKETTMDLFDNLDIVSQISKNLNGGGIVAASSAMSAAAAGHPMYTSETIAIFSARYYHKTTMPGYASASYDQNAGNTGTTNNAAGFYYYTDFAVFIISNVKLIEYAIHGHVSNINALLQKYNPAKIYYNSLPNKALDLFLRYPYQPFFAGITDQSKLTPIVIHRFTGNFNTLAFCERQEPYCAFCNGLRDIRGLLFQLPTHQNLDKLASTATFTMTRRQLLQQKQTATPQNMQQEKMTSSSDTGEKVVPTFRRIKSVIIRPEPKRLQQSSNTHHNRRHQSRAALHPYHQPLQRRHLRHAPKKSRRVFN